MAAGDRPKRNLKPVDYNKGQEDELKEAAVKPQRGNKAKAAAQPKKAAPSAVPLSKKPPLKKTPSKDTNAAAPSKPQEIELEWEEPAWPDLPDDGSKWSVDLSSVPFKQTINSDTEELKEKIISSLIQDYAIPSKLEFKPPTPLYNNFSGSTGKYKFFKFEEHDEKKKDRPLKYALLKQELQGNTEDATRALDGHLFDKVHNQLLESNQGYASIAGELQTIQEQTKTTSWIRLPYDWSKRVAPVWQNATQRGQITDFHYVTAKIISNVTQAVREGVSDHNAQKLNEIKKILGLGTTQEGHPIWIDLWDVQCRGLINCLKDKDWHGSGKPFGYPIYEITAAGGDQDFPPIMAPVGWDTVKWPVGGEDVYALRCYLHKLADIGSVKRKAEPRGLETLARVRDKARTGRTMQVSPKPTGKGGGTVYQRLESDVDMSEEAELRRLEGGAPSPKPKNKGKQKMQYAEQPEELPGTSADHEAQDLPDAPKEEFVKRPKKDTDEYNTKDEVADNEMEDEDDTAFLKISSNEDQREKYGKMHAKPPEPSIPHQILQDPTENDEDDLDYMDEDQDGVLGEDDAAQFDDPDATLGQDKYDTAYFDLMQELLQRGKHKKMSDSDPRKGPQVEIQERMKELGFPASRVKKDSTLKMAQRLAAHMLRAQGKESAIPQYDLFTEFLQPGAPYKTGDLNFHWESSMSQPWAASDVYVQTKMKITWGTLTPEEVKERGERLGADYIHGETIIGESNITDSQSTKDLKDLYHTSYPREETQDLKDVFIKGVDANYGYAIDGIFESKITENTLVHRKNLFRILCVYCDAHAIGTRMQEHKSNSQSMGITVADKIRGFKEGIWTQVWNGEGKRSQIPYSIYYGWKGKALGSNMEWLELWPPVFKNGFKELSKKEKDLFDVFKQSKNKEFTEKDATQLNTILSRFKSDMTVLQWVTSPWHYMYLPYQPQKAMFNDRETFSGGCLRCARPFHEFEFVYEMDRRLLQDKGMTSTSAWTKSHFHDNKDDYNKLTAQAPKPFDYPGFWKEENKVHDKDTAPGRRSKWSYYIFDMPKVERDVRYNGVSKKKRREDGDLERDLQARFRQCANYGYQQTVNDDKLPEDGYPTITQGRMAKKGTHVSYGMQGVMLRRHNKYCNVCFDCAQVLDSAPGLLIKNYRKLPVIERGQVGALRGNVGRRDDLWMTFAPFANMHDPNVREKFKGLQTDPVVVANYQEALRKMQEHHQTLTGPTKFLKDPPHIHVQTEFDDSKLALRKNPKPNAPKVKPTPEKDNLRKAMDTVEELLLNKDGHNVSAERLQEPAFRNLLREMQVKYKHGKELAVNPPELGVMHDPEQYRTEYRNEKRSDFGDGQVYNNCLRIVTWKPWEKGKGTQDARSVNYDDGAGGKKPGPYGDMAGYTKAAPFSGYAAEEYYTEVYYADIEQGVSVGRRCAWGLHPPTNLKSDKHWEEKTYNQTLWRGDYYLDKYPLSMQSTQHRKLQSTRLFITYTLHRSTRGLEARSILEKMANAINATFGNETVLANLLVFGKTLYNINSNKRIKKRNPKNTATGQAAGMRGKDESIDNLGGDYVSIAEYRQITAPNKADKLPVFYANSAGSSYVSDSYDTHVVSVDYEAGVEIGPKMKHPHFHILLTIMHYTYLQLDYFLLREFLEQLFTGSPNVDSHLVPYDKLDDQEWIDEHYTLLDTSGMLFYGSNENPWVDVQLYPSDNWSDIISAYVRKGSGGVFDAHKAHVGQIISGRSIRDGAASIGNLTSSNLDSEDGDYSD